MRKLGKETHVVCWLLTISWFRDTTDPHASSDRRYNYGRLLIGSLLKDGNQNGLGINSEFITSKMKNLFQNQMPKKWFLVLRICNHLSPSWWLISDIMRGPLGQKWISPFSVTHDTTGGFTRPAHVPLSSWEAHSTTTPLSHEEFCLEKPKRNSHKVVQHWTLSWIVKSLIKFKAEQGM